MSRTPAPPPETWATARRAVAAITAPIQRFLAVEAASGILLLVATVAALVLANRWPGYDAWWNTPVGGHLGPWAFEHPLRFWVNDGLMTVFFFVVGLEIRRETYDGELAGLRQAALPIAAALGGMIVPALIFAGLNHGRTGAAGWAVPMATDIAFAVGVLTLLGARAHPALRILLLALAVIDDIGAILVIAVCYSAGISLAGFGLAAAGVLAVIAMRGAGVRAPLLYVVPGAVVWAGLLAAGVHPTIAGVLLGLLAPVRPSLDRIEQARREAVSPVERLIHALHPWVAFAVMPVFALANAGVRVGGAELSGDAGWVFAGIVAGLAVGKPLGIAAATLGASRLGIAARSDDVTGRGVLLVGLIGGIGFTMSLFIAQLAFPPGPLLETAKLAILAGSGLAIVVGLGFGGLGPRRDRLGAARSATVEAP